MGIKIFKIAKKIVKSFHDQAIKLKWSEKIINDNDAEYNELKEYGVLKFKINFENFANYININYVKNILSNQSNKTPHGFFDNRGNDRNALVNHYLNLDDQQIKNFILNDSIMNILYKIYNKKVYLRNDPLLQVLNTKEKLTNGNFHTDRFMQFSLMLLLEDLSENETHMEYCERSHNRSKFDFIIHKNFEECQNHVKKNNFKIRKLIGKKGDAFLFNTIGIHRANYINGSKRSIFHLNFTNGHNLYSFKNQPIQATEQIFLRTDKKLKFTDSGWKFF